MTQQKLKESADLFHEVHFVEKWGKGIGKILELEPKTEFKELGRKFYNIFRKKEVQEKEGERLTQNHKLILKFIKKDRYISTVQLSNMVGINTKNMEKNLSKLKQKGLLKRIGPAKGGYWEVKEK